MVQCLFQLCGHRYILVMMVLTRVFGTVGGLLGVYYVDLTTGLPPAMQTQFNVAAVVAVSIAIVLSIPVALWNTRHLRPVLRDLSRAHPVDARTGRQAGVEAVCFARRQHLCELVEVPLCAVVALWVFLMIYVRAPAELLIQITIAAFLAMAAVHLMTFFATERWMVPVIHFLRNHGVVIDFEELPASQLRVRMNICISVMIVVTAVMIGSLANRRALDIIRNPQQQHEAVWNLRQHTVYITVSAVAVGLVLSRVLSNSMATRIDHMVEAMQRVRAGVYSERLQPTGTDEIDKLARQFNAMVAQLDHNDRTIRDLNSNLERKVRRRTRQLSRSRRKLKRSLQKLKEHDRLKTEFFSNVSHELRTPLTMILSPMNRILQTHHHRLIPEVRSLLEMMQLNGHRLLRLINQLLDFSKLQAGRAELRLSAVDVNQIVKNLATAAQPLAETQQIRLVLDLAERLPVVSADEEKLDTVITNLLSNALKFTPAGGTVRIQTAQRGGRLRVAVSDTGIGIARHDYPRVFQRFVQVDGSVSREFSGTGLGLPLAKELMELHGGRLRMTSRVGEGTCFWLTLPLKSSGEQRAKCGEPDKAPLDATAGSTRSDDHAGDTPGRARSATRPPKRERFADLKVCDVDNLPAAASQNTPDGELPRVLVVDDTPEMRYMIGSVLADEYKILYASDGRDALRVIEQDRPDLILCDVMMPGLDGYEVCRRVKSNAETAYIPLVLLTAKAAMAMKIEGLEHGADDYLVKPFDEEELRARVHSLLKLRRLYVKLDERNGELETTLSELKATQTQLVHSAKMVSLGELAAGLAHEINNAVNAIYNGIHPLCQKTRNLEELVETSLTQGADAAEDFRREILSAFEKIRALMDVVEHGAGRAVRLAEDLRTFSHAGCETPDWFDLHRELDICLALLANSSKGLITVVKDYQAQGRMFGPAGRLSQVFMNILKNSQEVVGERGRIVVSTREDDEQIVVTIGDDGPGMSEEVRSRVFDPFYTTKPPGAGTGLGLSVSYGIVTGLGGHLECESQPGRGTEFFITLPRTLSPGSQAESEQAQPEEETNRPAEAVVQ